MKMKYFVVNKYLVHSFDLIYYKMDKKGGVFEIGFIKGMRFSPF
jgi:hypothetical protein